MITNQRAKIITEVHRSGASAVARRIAVAWTARHWWLFAVPVAVVAVAGLYDWRWLVAGLFLVLVAVPGVLAMVYYYHALSPEAARATIPHAVTVDGKSLTISYHPDEGQWHPADQTVAMADIRQVEDTGTALVAWLRGPGYRYVEIPRAAFKSPEDLASTIQILQENDVFGTKFVE